MSEVIEPLRLPIGDGRTVSGLLQAPPDAHAAYVLAHGAGAGMAHPFLAAVADGLAQRGIATLRYQFPYMEQGARRPDAPATAHATVRAVAADAARRFAGLRLFAGGKSFGGRMTSQAEALGMLPDVQGLAFLGFPLHAAGTPSSTRGKHLLDVRVPMLFIQGTRDKLAEADRMQTLVAQLGPRATLVLIAEADHAFHVLVRSGRTDGQVLQEILDALAAWMTR